MAGRRGGPSSAEASTISLPPGATKPAMAAPAGSCAAGGSDCTVRHSTTRSKACAHSSRRLEHVGHHVADGRAGMRARRPCATAVATTSNATVPRTPSDAVYSASPPSPAPTTSAAPALAPPARGRAPTRRAAPAGRRDPRERACPRRTCAEEVRHHPTRNAGGGVPSIVTSNGVEGCAPRPRGACRRRRRRAAIAVAVPGAQHALAAEADPLKRGLRAAVAGVRPGGQPLHARAAGRPVRRSSPWTRSSRPSPRRGARARSRPWRGGRAARTPTARSCRSAPPRVDDEEVEQLARSRLAGRPRCRPPAASTRRVRAPGEQAGDRRVGGELEQRGASSARGVAQLSVGPRTTSGSGSCGVTAGPMLYTPDGGAALRRARQPARARGRARRRGRPRRRRATSSAATTRCSAAGRARPSRACARWSTRPGSAATASAGPPRPADAPDNPVVQGAIAARARRPRRGARRRPRRAARRARSPATR